MKSLVLFLGLSMSLLSAVAQDNQGVSITVTLENIMSDEGKILAGLHTVDTFMKGPGVDGYMEDAKTGSMTFTFENVSPGTYAVSVMHDENNNMAMDFEDNGMPIEKYGMSGNEMPMGPPTFENAKFEVADENLELKIRF